MKWIKRKLRKWLGVESNTEDIESSRIGIAVLDTLYADLTNIGIDVHFKSPSMILIFSQINGGQIRHIEADFKDLRELNRVAHDLKQQYRPRNIFYDAPPYLRERLQR